MTDLSAMPTQARPAATPTVTVCVCTRRRPDDLARTLASLVKSTYPVGQVVVSDDGHDQDTRAVCGSAPVDVDYVEGPQLGLGANRNRAIAAASGDIVLFLDDDCLLLPDFLQTAIARMRSAERRHGLGRVIVSGRELNGGQVIGAHDQTFLGFQSRPYVSDEGLRSIVINAALFPTAVFAQIEFDPRLVYGYEEVDFASRAAAASYVIVECSEAVNEHRPSPASREDHGRHVEASRLYVTLRRYLLTERAPLRALAFALIAPIHLVAADVKRGGPRGLRRAATTLRLTAMMLWRARKQ
jgi:GT2 family glycosyltransferase